MEALLIKNALMYVKIDENTVSTEAASNWEIANKKAKSDIILSKPLELKQVKRVQYVSGNIAKTTVDLSNRSARKATLLKQFMLHRMDDDGDVREYLRMFFDVIDKLAEMEININHDLLTVCYSIVYLSVSKIFGA